MSANRSTSINVLIATDRSGIILPADADHLKYIRIFNFKEIELNHLIPSRRSAKAKSSTSVHELLITMRVNASPEDENNCTKFEDVASPEVSTAEFEGVQIVIPEADSHNIDQRPAHINQLPHHVFSKSAKAAIVIIVSSAALLSGLSSNIYFPAQQDVANGLHITPAMVNFSITTYLIAQGLAPSFWSPLADIFGRRLILVATLVVYVLANIALALVQNAPMLLIFRALQAIGSSSTISLGAGVIADLTTPSERGGWNGIFSGARQSSIAIGPVLGGLLAGYLGFRSIFWFLTILSGCSLLAVVLFLPETHRQIAGNGSLAPARKRDRSVLSLIVGNQVYIGNKLDFKDDLERAHKEEISARNSFKWIIFTQPFSMLIEKDVICALLFGSCTYTAWSMMVATTTILLKTIYEFSTVQVGLCFLANGLGCVLGSVCSGRSLNKTFTREASLWRQQKEMPKDMPVPQPLPRSFPIERARLSEAPLYSCTMIIMFLVFGWSMTPVEPSRSAGHWIVPLLAQFAIGYSNTAVLNSNNTLIVDLYPGRSASASAVINLSRNLTAAAGVAIVDYIEDGVSPGWLGVILAAVVVVGLGPYALHFVYGSVWRQQREQKNEAFDIIT